MNDSSSVSFLALSCSHSPLHDRLAIEWACERIAHHEPDYLIHLGDFLEADAASRWPSEYDWTLKEEYASANWVLKRLRDSAPETTKCVWLEGNHDQNIISPNRINRKLRDLCDYRENIPEIANGKWSFGCPYVNDRERGAFRLGQVVFVHGYRAGQTADELQAPRFAYPYGLFVGGHTHRPKPVVKVQTSKSRVPDHYAAYYCNPGTVRDIDAVPYMTRKDRSGWGQGMVYGEAGVWRYGRSYTPLEKQWDAELEIFRMYES